MNKVRSQFVFAWFSVVWSQRFSGPKASFKDLGWRQVDDSGPSTSLFIFWTKFLSAHCRHLKCQKCNPQAWYLLSWNYQRIRVELDHLFRENPKQEEKHKNLIKSNTVWIIASHLTGNKNKQIAHSHHEVMPFSLHGSPCAGHRTSGLIEVHASMPREKAYHGSPAGSWL